MPSYSLAGGIDASYTVEAGKTTVAIGSKNRLKHRAVYTGTGKMLFHWVSTGKSSTWRCDISMPGSSQVQPLEATGSDGSQRLQVELGEVYPAACILRERMVGTLMAPAVHVDVPFGTDVWVFLVRSPWFPMRLQVGKQVLAVQHETSSITAALNARNDGSVDTQIAISGTAFKNASLAVRRTVGEFSSDETVQELTGANQSTTWKPIMRAFDLLLVTGGSMNQNQLVNIARGLGAQISSGLLNAGTVEGDFVLCDGPATAYTWSLKGHRGLLENLEDQTEAKFMW